MEIEHKIKIYSKEAYLVVGKITVGKSKRTLFSAAIRKISILLRLAKAEQVYPLCKLLDIKQQIDDTLAKVEDTTEVIIKQLAEKRIDPDAYSFPVKEEISLKFGNPLIYQLAKLLEKFDRLFCLLVLAKNTGIQLSKRHYFTEKDKHQQILFRSLSSIVKIDVYKLPKVTIDDFIRQTIAYHAIVAEAGEIILHDLYAALELSGSPYIDPAKREAYTRKLKLMASCN